MDCTIKKNFNFFYNVKRNCVLGELLLDSTIKENDIYCN